jgi:3-deoxy-manno-octulosonate cytidylyltransferase (CMP-KDO synthetase)
MSFVVIIPSRMKSTRLPEKPLKDIAGKPMIVRVAERALKSGADQVVVATDHESIVDACAQHGIRALLTDPDHPTGTDRLSEAARLLGLTPETIVVNVQGDEPLIPIEVISAVARELENAPDCAIATAAHPITAQENFVNPNVVKVELDKSGRAMTFTRAPVPWPRDAFREGKPMPEGHGALHHIGLYAYRAEFLAKFPALERAPIEASESLEQLRAMWHGYKIAVMVLPDDLPAGVDTQEDLDRVRTLWNN